MCILLALLVAGAASYTHGSRYALVGHGPFLTATGQSVDPAGPLTEAPPLGSTSPGQGAPPSSDLPVVPVTHQAGPVLDRESLERDCCERRRAPRGEPVPIRTGAVNAPSVLLWETGSEVPSPGMPSEPDLPALTVIQLSVSRT